MTRRSLLLTGLYILLQGAAALILLALVLGLSFGLRDAFCYPGYGRDLIAVWGHVTWISALLFAPGALLVGLALRAPGLAILPGLNVILAFATVTLADGYSRWVNAVHCRSGLPEVQDNTATSPLPSEILVAVALLLLAVSGIVTLITIIKLARTGRASM